MPVQENKPRVLCVTSSDWLGVARLPSVLASAGCRVSLLGPSRCLTARSRFVDELIPGSWDPGDNLELLRRHLEGGASYAWIILADDATMSAAALLGGQEWLSGWFPVDPFSDKPRLLASKTRFMEAAAAAGLPVPRSVRADSPEEIRAAAEKIGFPAIVKPGEGSGGEGIFSAASREELERRMPGPGSFVVQSFVGGASGGTVVLFDRGRPAWWMSSLRAEVWPEPFGPSSARVGVDCPGILEILEGVGRLLGVSGFCELDWVLAGDGRPRLLELNPRPPSYLYAATRLGGDLPGAIRTFLSGESAPPVSTGVVPGTSIRLFPEDLLRSLSRREYGRCARWLGGAGGPIPWDDPGLLRAYARLALKAFIKGALFIA